MSKTYQSLFLVCGSCKQAVAGDDICCKHCGRSIWLKDAEKMTKPAPAPVSAPVSAPIKKPAKEISNREKIIPGLQKWLPVIFPENHFVAPNPIPQGTLDFLAKNVGENRIQSMDILGYGYDSVAKGIFVFGEHSMLYYPQNSDRKSLDISYDSVKEVEESADRLTINGSIIISATQKRALAELLGSLTGAKVKMHNGSSTAITTGNNGGSPARKKTYTVNDYIVDKEGLLMYLVMLVTRVCLIAQGVVSISHGAVVIGIVFGILAFIISYHHPVIMLIGFLFCAWAYDMPDFGTGAEQSEWCLAAGSFYLIALVCRFIIGLRYKSYMAKGKK